MMYSTLYLPMGLFFVIYRLIFLFSIFRFFFFFSALLRIFYFSSCRPTSSSFNFWLMLIIHSLYSKSMGSDAHFHRMQPWCCRLLPSLLFPIPGSIAETPQICHPVSYSTDSPSIFLEPQYIPYFAHPPGREARGGGVLVMPSSLGTMHHASPIRLHSSVCAEPPITPHPYCLPRNFL